MNNLLNALPGQKDVDSAIKEVARASLMLTNNQFPTTKVGLQATFAGFIWCLRPVFG